MADILIRKNARYENRMANKDRIEWFILSTLFLQLILASIKLIEKIKIIMIIIMNGRPEPPSDIQDTCVDLLFLANLCKF